MNAFIRWLLSALAATTVLLSAGSQAQAPSQRVAQLGPAPSGQILKLDFARGAYWWNGPTTLAAAVTVARADAQISTIQHDDGTWSGFGPNTARIARGKGIRSDTQATNRMRRSRVFSDSVWTKTNLTLADAGDNPITGSQPVAIDVYGAGSTTAAVPENTTATAIIVLGAAGNGADGTANTNAGGGGGSGALSIKTGNTALGACGSIAIQVPAGGSGLPAFVKDCSSTTVASADSGTNASANTAGTGGALANGIGTTRRSGANGGSGSLGTGNRGGGGGAGAANDASLGGGTANGRAGSGGNTLGGGGGNSLGGGVTSSGIASAGVGGVGGTNLSNTGGGSGGTTTVPAGNGSNGGGGGGGLSGTGINGGNGSSSTWTVTSGLFSTLTTGAGGGGGGGGIGGGNGGNGGLGAGGGGGGSGAGTAGTKGTGGDGVVILVYGASNATRITATAANATLTQAVTLPTFDTTPSILMRPSTVTGPIYLSVDNCTTKTDISAQLIAGRYQQVFAPYQNVTNPTYCLQIANSGDAVDIDMAQMESTAYPTSPIPTTNTPATRFADFITLNVGAFPAFVTNDDLTVLATFTLGRAGTSVTGDTSRAGWAVFSIWGNGSNTVGSFTASIDDCTPSCGSGGSGNILNVTSASGLLGENCPVTGAGVAANTYINAQLTGTPNGVGTYAVSVVQTVASSAMTTTDASSYVMNGVVKPPPGERHNSGTTVVNCLTGLNYGYDPQIAQYLYSAGINPIASDWNRMAFTTRASSQAGTVSLLGNNEYSTPRGSWADPSKFTGVTLGSQRPAGINPIVGYIADLTILGKPWAAGQIAPWSSRSYPRRRRDRSKRGGVGGRPIPSRRSRQKAMTSIGANV